MNVLSKEYFKWIEEKTRDEHCIYYVSCLHEDENKKRIPELFNRIDKYVKDNCIFDNGEYGSTYNINDGKFFYTIYMKYGPDVVYLIKRTNNKVNSLYIDDIDKNVVRSRPNLETLTRMRMIFSIVDELKANGVPMERVEEKFVQHVRSLKK